MPPSGDRARDTPSRGQADRPQPPVRGAVRRGLRSTVGRESTTFGFSILVTATFGMLNAVRGTPDAPRVYWFAVGAVLSFTLLEAVLSRGFTRPMPQHKTHVLAVGTALNLVSVVAGVAVAWLAAASWSHAGVWALAPFGAAVVYLLLESLETALGERIVAATSDEGAAEVED